MSDTKMGDIIKASLEGIKDFTDVDTVFGKAVTTANGVTIIPVSKVSVGFASGGVDFANRRNVNPQNFGAGSGTGVAITPVAFLTVDADAKINLLEISPKQNSGFEKAVELIESSPDIIEKIKNSFSG